VWRLTAPSRTTPASWGSREGRHSAGAVLMELATWTMGSSP
jgi:hypothetical protein